MYIARQYDIMYLGQQRPIKGVRPYNLQKAGIMKVLVLKAEAKFEEMDYKMNETPIAFILANTQFQKVETNEMLKDFGICCLSEKLKLAGANPVMAFVPVEDILMGVGASEVSKDDATVFDEVMFFNLTEAGTLTNLSRGQIVMIKELSQECKAIKLEKKKGEAPTRTEFKMVVFPIF